MLCREAVLRAPVVLQVGNCNHSRMHWTTTSLVLDRLPLSPERLWFERTRMPGWRSSAGLGAVLQRCSIVVGRD